MSKTHWKSLTNPTYLGTYSFSDNADIMGTIKSVNNEVVTGEGGRKEECTICYFAENIKPMILNKTNMKTIQKIAGTPFVEEWVGTKISIYADPKVKFGREITGGLRIRSKALNIQASVLPKCEICGNDIQPLSSMTAEQVAAYTKSKYGQAFCSMCATKKAQEVKNNAIHEQNVDE